jgi:DNA-binding NtrC family response regulator
MSKTRILAIDLSYEDMAAFSNLYAARYKVCFAAGSAHSNRLAPEFKPHMAIIELPRNCPQALELFNSIKASLPEKTLIVCIASENTLALETFLRQQGIFFYFVKPYSMSDMSEILRAAAKLTESSTPSKAVTAHE